MSKEMIKKHPIVNMYFAENGERNIRQLQKVKELYVDRIATIFDSPDNEADKFESDNIAEFYDESDLFDEVVIHYWAVTDIIYQIRLAMICLVFQIWEQQICSNIEREVQNHNLLFSHDNNNSRLFNGFETVRNFFTERNYKDEKDNIISTEKSFVFGKSSNYQEGSELKECTVYAKIEELHLLVNTIKHSIGTSEQKLRNKRPDFFLQDEGTDLVQSFHVTIYNNALNVSDCDLLGYIDALIQFWKEIPRELHFNTKNLRESIGGNSK